MSLCLWLLAQDTLRAGFAEVDITPPVGTAKVGWNAKIIGASVKDPLYARAAIFESGGARVAFVQLDVLFIDAKDVAEIRKRTAENVLVSATHNHAGPAVFEGALPRDEIYVRSMIEKTAAAYELAVKSMQDAEIGFGSAFEWEVAHNRRIVMRNGTVRTHGSFKDPNALAFEGPIDPEVAAAVVRSADGKLLGALVNFACHPCHHGGDTVFSAGYPGVLAQTLKDRGIPITLFLQGACGNLHHADPRGKPEKSMDEAGRILADDVGKATQNAAFKKKVKIDARRRSIELPYREATPEAIQGKTLGAQRFGEAGYYDRTIPAILKEIQDNGRAKAELQVFFIDDRAFAAVPAEYFVQFGLRIKEETRPRRTWVLGYANGMLGYVPHKEAFARGGYETTFGPPSKLAPEAGDLIAEAVIELINK